MPKHILLARGPPTDDGDGVNFAPRRANSSDEGDHAPRPATSSSRDPMAHMKATRKEDKLESKMDFGPPLDEDGFPLHNVDIL